MKMQAKVCLAAASAVIALSAVPALAAKVCDVKKYGAKG